MEEGLLNKELKDYQIHQRWIGENHRPEHTA